VTKRHPQCTSHNSKRYEAIVNSSQLILTTFCSTVEASSHRILLKEISNRESCPLSETKLHHAITAELSQLVKIGYIIMLSSSMHGDGTRKRLQILHSSAVISQFRVLPNFFFYMNCVPLNHFNLQTQLILSNISKQIIEFILTTI